MRLYLEVLRKYLTRKMTGRTYEPAEETASMGADTKRDYRAIAIGSLYVLLWIWFCNLTQAQILHALVAGTLIALPLVLRLIYARRGERPWANHPKRLFQREYERQREEDTRRKVQTSDKRVDSLADRILGRNRDLLDKFLEIAERKVSVLDAYGDEKWDALPSESLLCIKKLAQREHRAIDWSEYSNAKRRIKRDLGFATKPRRDGRLNVVLPEEYHLIEAKLAVLFNQYHQRRKARSLEEIDVDALSGVEFQSHVAALLRSSGYDVIGLPISGDQGGDLIAKKGGQSYAIQTKRSERPVGNKAVQEAISAVSYYGADQAWVITNSKFTPSATALAQKANVMLIDGLVLRTKTFLYGSSKQHSSEQR